MATTKNKPADAMNIDQVIESLPNMTDAELAVVVESHGKSRGKLGMEIKAEAKRRKDDAKAAAKAEAGEDAAEGEAKVKAPRKTKFDHDAIAEDLRSGTMTREQIAAKHGISTGGVQNVAKKFEISTARPKRTPEQTAELMAAIDEIEARFGLSITTMAVIARKERMADAEGDEAEASE